MRGATTENWVAEGYTMKRRDNKAYPKKIFRFPDLKKSPHRGEDKPWHNVLSGRKSQGECGGRGATGDGGLRTGVGVIS